MYNAANLESVSEHDLEEDANDMPIERDPRFELQLEDGYHQNRLQLRMELMRLWNSTTLKEYLGSKGSKTEVELDLEVVEMYSLVEEMGICPSCWVSNSWGAVSR